MVDTTFGGIRDKDGDEFCTAFVDDCNISTAGRGNESYDDVVDRHLEQLEVFFTAAAKRKIQFKLEEQIPLE